MQKGEFFVTGEVFLLDIGLLMGGCKNLRVIFRQVITQDTFCNSKFWVRFLLGLVVLTR